MRLIHHDLRRRAKTIPRRGIDGNSEGFDGTQLCGHRQNRDGGMTNEEVRLNHQSWPGFAVRSGQYNGDQVASFHAQSSVSAPSAIQSSTSVSSGSPANDNDSRSHFRRKLSDDVSGSQSCTGLSPAARRASRCLRTRCVTAEPIADPVLHETYYRVPPFHATFSCKERTGRCRKP